MKTIQKTADKTLKTVLEVMRKRLDKINELEEENVEAAIKLIKNDELIKIANFVLGIVEKEEEKKAEEKKNCDEEGGEVRFILDAEIKDWAR